MSQEKLSLDAILADYQTLPEYIGGKLLDVNQRSAFGDFPLHVAAVRGSLEDIEILLEHGAHINAKGEHGFTPLHSAVEQGHPEAVELLLKHGADPKIENVYKMTPLELALLCVESDVTDKYKKIIECIMAASNNY